MLSDNQSVCIIYHSVVAQNFFRYPLGHMRCRPHPFFHIVFETLHRQRCFIHPETIPYGHLKRGTGGMGGNMNQNETNQNTGEKGRDTLHRPATQQTADPSTRINQTDAHDGAKTNTQNGASEQQTPSSKSAAAGKKAKKKSHKNVFLITFLIAALAVALVVLAAYLLGFRYQRVTASDGSEIKFLGRVNSAGIAQSGTLYLSSGSTAKVSAKDQTITYSNGDTYQGSLNENLLCEGQGTYTFADGSVYEGNFSGGLFNGEGTLTFSNGDVYVGSFVNGAKEGHGVYTRSDGSVYDGEFKDNKKEGHGVYTWPDGSSYDGEFSNDLKNGEGVFHFSNGDVYSGSFVDDARCGQGTYTWKESGDEYVGEFKDNTMNGYGTYTHASGITFEGYFENGQRVIQEEQTDATTAPAATDATAATAAS